MVFLAPKGSNVTMQQTMQQMLRRAINYAPAISFEPFILRLGGWQFILSEFLSSLYQVLGMWIKALPQMPFTHCAAGKTPPEARPPLRNDGQGSLREFRFIAINAEKFNTRGIRFPPKSGGNDKFRVQKMMITPCGLENLQKSPLFWYTAVTSPHQHCNLPVLKPLGLIFGPNLRGGKLYHKRGPSNWEPLHLEWGSKSSNG